MSKLLIFLFYKPTRTVVGVSTHDQSPSKLSGGFLLFSALVVTMVVVSGFYSYGALSIGSTAHNQLLFFRV